MAYTNHGADLLDQACAYLLQQKLVAFPTETVYGLGGCINQAAAIQKIYTLKQRPTHHPLIVHLAPSADVSRYAHITPLAEKIMVHYWPGPVSLVLDKTDAIDAAITGGQNSVAVRCPAHSIAQALLERIGTPLAAPSANTFGKISPTHAKHVHGVFNPHDVFVLPDAPDQDMQYDQYTGIESTIIDARGASPRILRLGMLHLPDFCEVMRVPMQDILTTIQTQYLHADIRVSGNLHAHYAPNHKLLLKTHPQWQTLPADVTRTHILMGLEGFIDGQVPDISMPCQATQYAQMLYARLRDADAACAQQGKQGIICHVVDEFLCQNYPRIGPYHAWLPILDRLSRAAY